MKTVADTVWEHPAGDGALCNTVIGLMHYVGATNIAAACHRFATQPVLVLEIIGMKLKN